MRLLAGRRRAGRARRRSGRRCPGCSADRRSTWNIAPQSPARAPARQPRAPARRAAPRRLTTRVERRADRSSMRVERLGLRDRAREAVEHEARARSRPRQALLDDADHDLVGHQLAARPCSACACAPERACRCAAPRAAGRRSRSAERRSAPAQLRLRALPGARGTQQHDAAPARPYRLPRMRPRFMKPS